MLDSFCSALGRRRRSSVPYLVTTRAFLLECTEKQLRPVSQVKGPWGQRRRCAPAVAHVLQRTIRRHDRTPRGKPPHAPANSNCLRLEFEWESGRYNLVSHVKRESVIPLCSAHQTSPHDVHAAAVALFPGPGSDLCWKRDVSCRLHVPSLPSSPAASSCVFVVVCVRKKIPTETWGTYVRQSGLAETAARTSQSLRLRESFKTCAWKGVWIANSTTKIRWIPLFVLSGGGRVFLRVNSISALMSYCVKKNSVKNSKRQTHLRTCIYVYTDLYINTYGPVYKHIRTNKWPDL